MQNSRRIEIRIPIKYVVFAALVWACVVILMR